jgi:hypothetical protein
VALEPLRPSCARRKKSRPVLCAAYNRWPWRAKSRGALGLAFGIISYSFRKHQPKWLEAHWDLAISMRSLRCHGSRMLG